MNSNPIVHTCKFLIENKLFSLANNIINGLMNSTNVRPLHNSLKNTIIQKKNTYVVLVEANGNGHATQMINLIKLLEDTYRCTGIVVGRKKQNVIDFAESHNIPVLYLKEPDYVSSTSSSSWLLNTTLEFIVEYNFLYYKTVSNFVNEKYPEFIINLHLPIKFACTVPVINISTQNRINFDNDYKKVLSSKFDRFSVNAVLFTSFVIHNSFINSHKIAIDSLPQSTNINFTIPPLISTNSTVVSKRNNNTVVCYFNKLPSIYTLRTLNNYTRANIVLFLPDNLTINGDYSNIEICVFGDKFFEVRENAIGVITSCGVETVYETFLLAIPMVCIPSNPEQLFNAYDHSRKIPGFHWTYDLEDKHINQLLDFEYSTDYWLKHQDFLSFYQNKTLLKLYIQSL